MVEAVSVSMELSEEVVFTGVEAVVKADIVIVELGKGPFVAVSKKMTSSIEALGDICSWLKEDIWKELCTVGIGILVELDSVTDGVVSSIPCVMIAVVECLMVEVVDSSMGFPCVVSSSPLVVDCLILEVVTC